MGATFTSKFDALFMRGISLNADGAGTAITVVPSDSGICFVNNEDADTVTYTLPAVADCEGKIFFFYNNQTTQNIAVTGGTAAKISANDHTGYDTVTDNGVVGNWGFVIGDGDYYYFFAGSGTWTAST